MKVIIKARAERGFYRCGLFFPFEGRVIDPADLTEAQRVILAGEPNLRFVLRSDEEDDAERIAAEQQAADAAAAEAALAGATPGEPIAAIVQVGDTDVSVQVVGLSEDGAPVVTDASFNALQAAADAQGAADAAKDEAAKDTAAAPDPAPAAAAPAAKPAAPVKAPKAPSTSGKKAGR